MVALHAGRGQRSLWSWSKVLVSLASVSLVLSACGGDPEAVKGQDEDSESAAPAVEVPAVDDTDDEDAVEASEDVTLEPSWIEDPEEWTSLGSAALLRTPFAYGDSAGPGVWVTGDATVFFADGTEMEVTSDTVLPGEDVQLLSSTTIGPVEDPKLVVMAEVRKPSSGLEAAAVHLEMLVLDSSGDEEARWTLFETEHRGFSQGAPNLPVVGGDGRTVAVMREWEDDWAVEGYDLDSGERVWRQDGWLAAAVPGMVAVLAGDPAAVPGPEGDGCSMVRAINVADGKVAGEVRAHEYRSPDGECVRMGVYDRRGSGVSDGAEALRWFNVGFQRDSRDGGVPAIHLDGRSGGRLPIDPDFSVDFADPDTSLVVDRLGGTVLDADTGQVVYDLAAEASEGLEYRVTGLENRLLYVDTDDEELVVDVMSGDIVTSEREWVPVAHVGEWTLYSDGYFGPRDRTH